MAAPFTVFVTVSCTTVLGDSVAVSGNAAELGAWAVDAAIPLSTTPGTYPVWQGAFILTGAAFVEFKFIVVRADGSATWEEGSNRCGAWCFGCVFVRRVSPLLPPPQRSLRQK